MLIKATKYVVAQVGIYIATICKFSQWLYMSFSVGFPEEVTCSFEIRLGVALTGGNGLVNL